MPKLFYPENGFVFDTHTEIQNEFIRRIGEDGIQEALVWLEPVKNNREVSRPAALEFRWEKDGTDVYTLEVSENEAFTAPMTVKTGEDRALLDNFKIGQTYFWRVNGGEVRSFTTKNEVPRFIRIPDVLNVRDIGGTSMKQGMVYRGSELDFYPITDEGRKIFTEQLKIKTDLDLRATSQTDKRGGISAAGESVVFKPLPYRPYGEVFEEQHREGIVRIMEFLADETIYPIYIHCSGGADRAGMIALYLRSICGESDEDIHRDYEMTSLSTYAGYVNKTGFRHRYMNGYNTLLDGIEQYAPGGTIREKAIAFLLDCGVKQETMVKIASILKK